MIRSFIRARAAFVVGLPAALLLGLLVAGAPAGAAELHVAVAANFLGTLQKLAIPYQATSGNTLIASGGSSGQLYTQIHQGAPYDLFFSADADRPQKLSDEGLIVPGSRFTYVVGTVVLWSPKAGVVDRAGRVLTRDAFQHLAIADPKAAPYGTAAQQVMTALGVWDRLNQQRKLVVGENITNTFQFIASGNANLGFVALSQVIGPQQRISGSYWLPPQKLYTPITQDAVILKRTTEPRAAQNFVQWLRSAPPAREILRAAGYRLP